MTVNIDLLRDFFMWCSIINIAALIITWLFFSMGSDWIYRMHSKWFKISQEQFHASWYVILGFYKISVSLFCVVPYIALLIIS